MAPRRRATTRQVPRKEKEVIYISSDSEADSHAQLAKRPKTSNEGGGKPQPPKQVFRESTMHFDADMMNIDEWSLPISASERTQAKSPFKRKERNTHLKGRKRFIADLQDLSLECVETPIEVHGLQVKSLRAGDEEGSIELKIIRAEKPFISLILLIDDTTSYPRDHTYFSFAQDAELPPHILEVIENTSTLSPKPLINTVISLLASLSASFSQGKYVPQNNTYVREGQHEDEADSDDLSNYEDYIDYGFESVGTENLSHQFAVLKEHFHESIDAGYKPGLTRLNDNEIVLSISSPVLSLSIPPRALVAWDRRLLMSCNNLVLFISGIHGSYPILNNDGSYMSGSTTQLKFHVGVSPSYKPSKEVVLENVRNFGLARPEDKADLSAPFTEAGRELDDPSTAPLPVNDDSGGFEKISLSSSLESVLSHFVSILQLRLKFRIGWAGAEILHAESTQYQQKPEELYGPHEKDIRAADDEEALLQRTYSLPQDPLEKYLAGELNLPLFAYSYLIRRLTLCTRYCLVCHTKIRANFEALKPYVCDSKLCIYQYYALNLGLSIEYEICNNPKVVDLLVSLTYVSALENQLSDSLPIGLGLRVPPPKPLPHINYNYGLTMSGVTTNSNSGGEAVSADSDGLCDFDKLSLALMRVAIVEMIETLPPIASMKEHLERKAQNEVRPQLRSMGEQILPAAWSILRWCVASFTAYLEEISDKDEVISNISPGWRQFRFSVGAPDKEARYQTALVEVQKREVNALRYPAIYGFHGSPLRNWHSIMRQGLLVKQVVHGRAYGDGVYFAKDGAVSMGQYAQVGMSKWSNSEIRPLTCVALAQIINAPREFTNSNPYYVVKQVDWILCRYLLVKTDTPSETQAIADLPEDVDMSLYVRLDPSQPLTMHNKQIMIPEESRRLQRLLEARKAEQPKLEPFDEEDLGVLSGTLIPASLRDSRQGAAVRRSIADDWQHSEKWCDNTTYQVLPPPSDSTPRAALALQKELRAMLKDQEKAEKEHNLTELGWYIPPELMGDNLFCWMIELHSFDSALPIAQDMVQHNIPSLLFEVRFPPTFPIQPPFFRIIKPRLLPFIHGGGGHVTGGGSICMDLLVSDGWLPSYSLAAILLQIKLAISNLEPRPARLGVNWNTPYSTGEALEGFKRAARTHGWTVPEGIERLVR
ncbi:hypothetical protein K439DRAFT_1636776 [Ramaria rubella]|nr:hypothetical protein K439DRAFT_1636776 [Ramaria rubella]